MGWFSDITSAIGDVFSPISSLVSAGASLFGTEETNAANAQQAANQQAFQASMSNSSYQRAVADLKAAGLNPMLAYSNGGASTPTGAQATMQNPLSNAVSSAQAQKQLDATVDSLKAQTDLARNKSFTEAATQDLLTQQVEAQSLSNKLSAATIPFQISTSQANSALAAASLPAAVNEADFQKSVSKMPYLKNLLSTVHDLLGSANSAKAFVTPK